MLGCGHHGKCDRTAVVCNAMFLLIIFLALIIVSGALANATDLPVATGLVEINTTITFPLLLTATTNISVGLYSHGIIRICERALLSEEISTCPSAELSGAVCPTVGSKITQQHTSMAFAAAFFSICLLLCCGLIALMICWDNYLDDTQLRVGQQQVTPVTSPVSCLSRALAMSSVRCFLFGFLLTGCILASIGFTDYSDLTVTSCSDWPSMGFFAELLRNQTLRSGGKIPSSSALPVRTLQQFGFSGNGTFFMWLRIAVFGGWASFFIFLLNVGMDVYILNRNDLCKSEENASTSARDEIELRPPVSAGPGQGDVRHQHVLVTSHLQNRAPSNRPETTTAAEDIAQPESTAHAERYVAHRDDDEISV